MPDAKNKLFLYEALELRAELDARIKTIKDCLPESKQNRDRFSLLRGEESVVRPSPDFDVAEARSSLAKLELKKRKLNNAIQRANFNHGFDFEGERISLSEALETRKALSEKIGELHQQVVAASRQRVIYKEGRDIVEPSDISYPEGVGRLDEARVSFRVLNRLIRQASFEVTVDFQDE